MYKSGKGIKATTCTMYTSTHVKNTDTIAPFTLQNLDLTKSKMYA